MLLKGALKSFYKQQSKLILFQSNVYLNLLFQESLPLRIPNPIFIVLMMDSKKRLGWVFQYFWRLIIKRAWFSLFLVLKRIEYPLHHWNVLLFTWMENNLLLVIFFLSQVGKIRPITIKRVSVCFWAAWYLFRSYWNTH